MDVATVYAMRTTPRAPLDESVYEIISRLKISFKPPPRKPFARRREAFEALPNWRESALSDVVRKVREKDDPDYDEINAIINKLSKQNFEKLMGDLLTRLEKRDAMFRLRVTTLLFDRGIRQNVFAPIMADAYAGLYGSTATMMALRHAEATGEGQVIDLSLFEPIFAILEPQMANYAVTGAPKPRTGSRSTNTAPRNAYRTKDGKWVGLSSSTQSVFERLMRSIGQEALLADPRFATNSDRLRNIEAIDGVIRDAVATMTLAEALAQFDRDGVTIGPILDVSDLATDAYVREREALIAVPDAEMPGGLLPMHGQVPRLSRTPGALRCPAPRLGQDTRDVLAGALGAAEAERLIMGGVAIGAKE